MRDRGENLSPLHSLDGRRCHGDYEGHDTSYTEGRNFDSNTRTANRRTGTRMHDSCVIGSPEDVASLSETQETSRPQETESLLLDSLRISSAGFPRARVPRRAQMDFFKLSADREEYIRDARDGINGHTYYVASKR